MPATEPDPSEAVRLVGLLADDDRRTVVAALALGASSAGAIREMTGLEPRSIATALHRLVVGDLVVQGDDGSYVLLESAFVRAARLAAPSEPAGPDPDAPPDAQRVLRAFVRDGRLLQIPTARSKRLVVLDLVAQDFEPGRRYSESTVNLVLQRWHDDHAALRRHLVDEAFLTREAGEYWRSGGSVPVR
jgi:hypothetical protein